MTEDVCALILEKESRFECEVVLNWLINPGDKVHRLELVTKMDSVMDEETLDMILKAYVLVIEAGDYRAGTIRAAEAAKNIKNSQRDINIAFMNDLFIIFHIDWD